MPFTRCMRCEKFFETSERDRYAGIQEDIPDDLQCWYHPGRFSDPDIVLNGILVGWSCCRSDDKDAVRKEALHRDCKGCVYSGLHEEDVELTEMILLAQGGLYGRAVVQSSASSNGPHLQERKTSSEKEEGDVIVEEEKSGEKEKTTTTGDELPYIEHRVLPSDSLYSLALRYNVSVESIRAANMISAFNTFIQHHPVLRIPKVEGVVVSPKMPDSNVASRRQYLVKRFVMGTKGQATEQEAVFYLEEVDYDVARALATWRGEIHWEKRNPRLPDGVGESHQLLVNGVDPSSSRRNRKCC